jgi:hypothetical protein
MKQLVCSSGTYRKSDICNAYELTRKLSQQVHAYKKNYKFIIHTLSKENVFVTANAQPASKALRIIALEVAGGADANPNGLMNFIPHISTLISTSSTGVWNFGSWGSSETFTPTRH